MSPGAGAGAVFAAPAVLLFLTNGLWDVCMYVLQSIQKKGFSHIVELAQGQDATERVFEGASRSRTVPKVFSHRLVLTIHCDSRCRRTLVVRSAAHAHMKRADQWLSS